MSTHNNFSFNKTIDYFSGIPSISIPEIWRLKLFIKDETWLDCRCGTRKLDFLWYFHVLVMPMITKQCNYKSSYSHILLQLPLKCWFYCFYIAFTQPLRVDCWEVWLKSSRTCCLQYWRQATVNLVATVVMKNGMDPSSMTQLYKRNFNIKQKIKICRWRWQWHFSFSMVLEELLMPM